MTAGRLSWGDVFYRSKGVDDSPELSRIVALPRRDWRTQATDLAPLLTRALKVQGGTQTLRPIQAAMLKDIFERGGAFGPIRVGGGKTLISLLAFTVLESKRPLLLLPAKLVEKTEREMEILRQHWDIPKFVRIVSYDILSRVSAEHLLENYLPDVIVADECHRLKNSSAAVTRRVKRHMKTHPATKFVGLSGTITKRSIRDYSHLLEWALKESTPAPRDWPTLIQWSGAIDERKVDEPVMPPGNLVKLLHTPELRQEYATQDCVRAIRKAYRDRLVQTPGVISSYEDVIGNSLSIRGVDLDLPPDVLKHFRRMRDDQETPDGHPIATPVELWRHCRELAAGFYYRWNPRPPQEWLEARREWCKTVREILKSSRSLDSEMQVAMAIVRGDVEDGGVYAEWKAIRDTFRPNVEAVWVHDRAVEFALDWAKKPGIIWTDLRAFGERMAERGLRYFGAEGRDLAGPIESADPRTCVVASVASNSEGRNLQAWSRNLIISAPPTGALWEQMLGRTHRDGQEADEVEVEILLGCREQNKGFWRAVSDAIFIEQTTGQPQKLSYADISVRKEE